MVGHPTNKLIQQSNHLPKIPKAFGGILTMLLEPYTFNMDNCIDKLSSIPELESDLIKALNYNSKLNRNSFRYMLTKSLG